MTYTGPDEIAGVLMPPLVAGIVEILKALGMQVRYAVWANAILSIAFVFVAQAFEMLPEYQSAIQTTLQIAVMVLTTAGFYSVAMKSIIRKRFNR